MKKARAGSGERGILAWEKAFEVTVLVGARAALARPVRAEEILGRGRMALLATAALPGMYCSAVSLVIKPASRGGFGSFCGP